jgi:hypothetical protein
VPRTTVIGQTRIPTKFVEQMSRDVRNWHHSVTAAATAAAAATTAAAIGRFVTEFGVGLVSLYLQLWASVPFGSACSWYIDQIGSIDRNFLNLHAEDQNLVPFVDEPN